MYKPDAGNIVPSHECLFASEIGICVSSVCLLLE